MTEKFLKPLSWLVPVISALHVYLSFQWLSKLLAEYGINRSGIITLEDVLFHFGDLNQTIVMIGLSGFALSIYFRFILGEKVYANLNKKVADDNKVFLKILEEAFQSVKKRWVRTVILSIISSKP